MTSSKNIETPSSTGPGQAGNLSFESAFEQLQATVKKLESGELSLDKSLQQFEEGVRLTRLCQEQLSVAEQKVEILMKSGNDHSVEFESFKKN